MKPPLTRLRSVIRLACQASNIGLINTGRQQVLEMPRHWVLTNFKDVVVAAPDLTDYWEYLQVLELADMLGSQLVHWLVPIGLSSNDPDVREAAEDWSGG